MGNMNFSNGGRPSRNSSNVKPSGSANAASRANNVYSDREGNVFRQNNETWQQNRGGDRWENANPTSGSKSGDIRNQSIDRSRGTQRYDNFQQNRVSPGGGGFSRPGGAGGGRSMPGRR